MMSQGSRVGQGDWVVIGKLKKRPDFVRLSSRGKFFVTPGLLLQMACSKEITKGDDKKPMKQKASIRVGYTASRKVGNAVARNRAKRRLRALVRAHMPAEGLAGHDYVFVARRATPQREWAKLEKDMTHALKYLHEGKKMQKGEGA